MKTSSLYIYLFLFLIVFFAVVGGFLIDPHNYNYLSKEGMAFRHIFGSLHGAD
jgi:hypothetical protein